MTYTPSQADQIAHAAGRLVLDLNIVPVGTLAVPIAAGDASCQVALVNGTPPAWLLTELELTIWDWTWEPPVKVTAIASDGTLTLDWTGHTASNRQAASFLYDHEAGARVTTNLFWDPLQDNSPALANGYPVVGSYVLDDTISGYATGQDANMAILTVHHQLASAQNSGARQGAQGLIAAKRRWQEQDLDALTKQLESNRRLQVDGDYYAENWLKIMRSRRTSLGDSKKPVYEQFLDCQIIGRKRTAARATVVIR